MEFHTSKEIKITRPEPPKPITKYENEILDQIVNESNRVNPANYIKKSKRTENFEDLIKYYKGYEHTLRKNNKKINIRTEEEKMFFTLIYALTRPNDSTLKVNYKLDIELHNSIDSYIFFSEIAVTYDADNIHKYLFLTPYDITLKYIEKIGEKIYKKYLKKLDRKLEPEKFIEELEKLNREEKAKIEENIKEEYYEKQNEHMRLYYLALAPNLRYVYERSNNDFRRNLIQYKILIALLSIFDIYYDTNDKENEELIKKLENIGITRQKIREIMDITDNPPPYRIETTQLALLKTYFPISIYETPKKIIQELLKKHEAPFLDILNYLKVDIIKLKNILGLETTRDNIIIKTKKIESKIKTENKDLPIETKEKIKRLMQIIKYIKQNKTHFNKFINGSETTQQILELAILINSYHSNSYISNFFIKSKIPLERLEILFDINLEENIIEEIDVTKEEMNELIEIYNEISEKLLNENINNDFEEIEKKHIMVLNAKITTNLYEYFTGIKIENSIIEYIENFNKEYIEKKLEKLLYGLNNNVKLFVRGVIRNYYEIEGELTEETKETIAILEKVGDLGNYNGLLKEYICGKLGITNHLLNKIFEYQKIMKSKTNKEEKIDRIRKYIYEGINKGKQPYEITIESIIENTLSKEIFKKYKKTPTEYILEKLNQDKTSLINLEEHEKILVEQKEQEKLEREIIELEKRGTYEIINYATKIYKELENNKIYEEYQKVDFSMILSYLIKTNLLENDNYIVDEILNKLNIQKPQETSEFIEKSTLKIIKKNLLLPESKTYTEQSIEKLIEPLFENIYHVLEKQIGNDINKINFVVKNAKEITKKQERKKKIIELQETKEIINEATIEKLLRYGESLEEHINIISETIKEAALKEYNHEYLNKLIESYLSAIHKDKEYIPLIKESLKKLMIEENKELETYTFIANYIEEYLKKLDMYIKNLEYILEQIKEEIPKNDLEKINDENKIQIINAKSKGFKEQETILKVELLKTYKKQLSTITNLNKIKISRLVFNSIESEINANIFNIESINKMVEFLNNIITNKLSSLEENIEKLNQTEIPEDIKEILKKELIDLNENKKKL